MQEVRIEVSGGVAEIVQVSAGIRVILHDYDNEKEMGKESYEPVVVYGPYPEEE